MKEFGKRPLNRILLAALILFVGAGATYASLRPVQFRAGMTAVVDWMKFDMIAEAAKKDSSSAPPSGTAVSSAPVPSAPASSAAPQSQTSEEPSSSEAEKISLDEAAKPLKINVSLKDQKVSILDAKDRLVQEYVCSSGEAGNDTPTGTFTVTDRGKSFYNPAVKEGAYYWTRFYKTFLFHSVPFDENQKMEPQEAAKLGTPASHGCIRLETANAKWIYDNIPEGTTVVVR